MEESFPGGTVNIYTLSVASLLLLVFLAAVIHKCRKSRKERVQNAREVDVSNDSGRHLEVLSVHTDRFNDEMDHGYADIIETNTIGAGIQMQNCYIVDNIKRQGNRHEPQSCRSVDSGAMVATRRHSTTAHIQFQN